MDRIFEAILANPISIPILLLVTWVGIMYGWRELTKYQNQRGKPLRPLGSILKDQIKFAFKEDTRPLITAPKKVAEIPVVQKITARVGYFGLVAGSAVGFWLGTKWGPLLALGFVFLFGSRYSKISRQRRGIVGQMFAVASAECRYPRGSELAPWGYINVSKWHNMTEPGDTIVSYPPAYQSEEQKTREKFERQFNGTISDQNTWDYTWESAKNRVICEPTAFLPTMAPYPGPSETWSEIQLGQTNKGVAKWDLTMFPHALICGPTGSGKSVLQRMILFHCLVNAGTWDIVGVDPKMVEMTWLKDYPNVKKIALTLEEGVEVVENVRDEMNRRYTEMSEIGVNHFTALPNPPRALLCMVDETFNFLAPEGIKSDEGKERDALHARASSLLGEIARLGRAAGVHLCLATQRPDATVIKGELKNNLDCRIAAGRLDTTPSLMVLDSEAATRLPKIKGRGMIRSGGEMETFQGFFAEQAWFDEFVAAAQAAVRQQEEEAAGTVADEPVLMEKETAPASKKGGLFKKLSSGKGKPADDEEAVSSGEEIDGYSEPEEDSLVSPASGVDVEPEFTEAAEDDEYEDLDLFDGIDDLDDGDDVEDGTVKEEESTQEEPESDQDWDWDRELEKVSGSAPKEPSKPSIAPQVPYMEKPPPPKPLAPAVPTQKPSKTAVPFGGAVNPNRAPAPKPQPLQPLARPEPSQPAQPPVPREPERPTPPAPPARPAPAQPQAPAPPARPAAQSARPPAQRPQPAPAQRPTPPGRPARPTPPKPPARPSPPKKPGT